MTAEAVAQALSGRKADGRTLIEAAELYRIVRELPAIGRQPDTATIDPLTTTTGACTELRRRITEIVRDEFAKEPSKPPLIARRPTRETMAPK